MTHVFATLVLSVGDRERYYHAEHSAITIGRSQSSSIRLMNESVSSKHAKVVFDPATGEVCLLPLFHVNPC